VRLPTHRFSAMLMRHLVLMLCLTMAAGVVHAQGAATDGSGASVQGGGPIRLRQPSNVALSPGAAASAPQGMTPGMQLQPTVEPYQPSEFELFVQRRAGIDIEEQQRKAAAGMPIGPTIRRFGAELMTPQPGDSAIDAAPLVPPDHLIKPGDELLVTLWGSVDADLRLPVDRNGRITLPRVGPVLVAGVRYADLPSVISQRIGQVFRNFQLSVALGQLRGQRIYVTGFVARPGSYTVNSLATVAQALLQAGGPTAAGSYRRIELRRGNQRIAALDLYDVLLRGDRSADATLQGEDVIHVGPIGAQVGFIGSVNRAAVFELKPGENLGDVLSMAGGFSAVADTSRVAIERLDERSTVRIVEVALPDGARSALQQGDLLRAFSAVEVAVPVQRQNKRVRVEGEVARPGEYVLPPASTIADALRVAGGITAAAYTFGTEFSRESVRVTQQQNYDRALRDLETDLARANTSRRTTSSEEAATLASRETANTRLIASLRALRPNGRIVLQLPPDGRELPPLALEDGDRLFVPPRPTSVGVFGSVFNGGSYLYSQGRSLDDYLALAGGPTRGADASSTFVIRANGSVVSNQQQRGWLGRNSNFGDVVAEPGDTIFVPEELDKTTFVQAAKDWTQILYQFGLGIAGIVSASR
jgi:protein involved in polysaccharide export with SLBB domain